MDSRITEKCVDQLGWPGQARQGKNVNSANLQNSMDVVNVKLCMMVKLVPSHSI